MGNPWTAAVRQRAGHHIRNISSAHWRRWLEPESRCLMRVKSFCEWADAKLKKTPTWFALDVSRLLFAFAGI